MKTVYVAVVVLSLISVCQPASLECKKLVKPVDQGPDILGRWYFLGMSLKTCWPLVLINSLLVPSLKMDITSTERQHYYDANVKMKAYVSCENDTMQFLYANNTIFEVDGKKADLKEEKAVLLQSGCQDCLVISADVAFGFLVLLSRRPVITADEMKEFETQAECLGLYKPQIFGSDHDFGNCGTTDFESSELSSLLEQRVRNMFSELLTCSSDTVLDYPRAAYSWAKQTWDSLW